MSANAIRLEIFELPAVVILLVTGSLLLVSQRWRTTILALGVQYLAVFVLTAMAWPLGMALVKLVAGWIAGAVLVMALRAVPIPAPPPRQIAFRLTLGRSVISFPIVSGELFRLIAAAMMILVVFSVAPRMSASGAAGWVPGISPQQATGGLLLIGLGLLHLGLTGQPFRVVVGLLTVLAGFEIIYAALEISSLVAGLLAGVNLSLSLVGAFLIIAPFAEAEI